MSSAAVISPHLEICRFLPSQLYATTLGMTSGSKVKRGPAWPGNNRCGAIVRLFLPHPPTVWLQSARISVGGSWRRIDGRSKSGGEEQTRRSGGDLGSELISLNNQKPKRIFMTLRFWCWFCCGFLSDVGALFSLHGAEKGRRPPPPRVTS